MSVELPNLEACPGCGYVMALTTGVCGALDARKALREPTPDEVAAMQQSESWPTIRRAQAIILARGPLG